MSRYLSESEAWRHVASVIDENPNAGLYGACFPETFGETHPVALKRLCLYDDTDSDYGPGDDYANMGGPDKVLAALWLALEAEDEAHSLPAGTPRGSV